MALPTLWRQMEPLTTAGAPIESTYDGQVARRNPRAAPQKLRMIAMLMPLIYWAGLTWPYPLSFGLANPRGTWVIQGAGSLPTLALQIGFYLLLTTLYLWALQLLDGLRTQRERQPNRGLIWLSWLLCSAVLLGAAPNGESHDLYDYIFRGRMLDRYGASPLLTTPNAYPDAPYYRYVAWKRHVDTYGPLWEYTSAATAKGVRVALTWRGDFHEETPSCPETPASCRTLVGYLIGYRLLAILLTGASALVLQRIVGTMRPNAVPLTLALWLWNPLLLIASALGAHNDALMLFFLMLGFFWWQRGRWLGGWLAFGLATQVKLTALLLVPALGLWLVRQLGWWRALWISLLAAILTLGCSWLLYAPLGGWATLPRMLYERQLFVANSPAQILYFLLYKWSSWPYPLVWQMMVTWGTLLFLPAAALLFLRAQLRMQRIHDEPLIELARTCTLLTLLFLLIGSFWFQSWYFVWVLAPATLWIDGRLPYRGLPWATCGALCSNVIYDQLTQLPIAAVPDAHLYRIGVTVLVVAAIWLPLLARQVRA